MNDIYVTRFRKCLLPTIFCIWAGCCTASPNLDHHFSSLFHYLGIYMIERSKEYQISDECNVWPTCQKGVFHSCTGREVKKFFAAWILLLTYSS